MSLRGWKKDMRNAFQFSSTKCRENDRRTYSLLSVTCSADDMVFTVLMTFSMLFSSALHSVLLGNLSSFCPPKTAPSLRLMPSCVVSGSMRMLKTRFTVTAMDITLLNHLHSPKHLAITPEIIGPSAAP